MLAVRWHGRRDVRLEDVELALPLGPGMIEAAVAYCGICGSDVAEFAHGPFAIRERRHVLSDQAPPITLGHEFSGRVTAVGPGVTRVAVGDRVAADACWRCERCEACASGAYNRCPSGGSIGLCSDGGLAERVRFPAYAAVPVPHAVSARAAALLEPLAVGVHALDRASAHTGDVAVVLGFGPIGAATAAVARAKGLDVLVSEPNPGRRARAAAMDFEVHAPTGQARDDAREVRGRTDGGANIVVDATGSTAAITAAFDMTGRGGTVVLVGIPKEPLSIDGGRLVLYERALVASLGYVDDLPRAAEMIASRALDVEPLITRTIDLHDVPDELARMADTPTDDIKVLVEIDASDGPPSTG